MINLLSVDTDHEAIFDGNALFSEQMELLSNATPAEIKDICFLKLKLSVTKKSTAQQNQFQRASQQWDGEILRLQQRDGGGPFARSNSLNLPPNLKAISGSPLQHPTQGVLGNENMNFSLAKVEGSRPLGNLSSQLTGAPRGSLVKLPITSSSANTSLKEDTSDLAPHNPMDELPASVMMRRTLSGGIKTISPAPSDAYNNTNNTLQQAKSTLDGEIGFLGIDGALPKDELMLEPCIYCGRTFATESLKRHVDACRRHHESNGKSSSYNAKLRQSFQISDSSFSASVLSRLDTRNHLEE
ncbi:unnamed protein product [Phytomonas sp. Hart1]|nr:unnamed protein product [Phytomonas sp. Hart1]|eukprot:CCW67461.1 unnamed protein product [Phytomonas sp. isolate Hart1]